MSQALRTELLTDPAGIGYAEHTPHAPGVLLRLLNEPTADAMPGDLFLTDLAIASRLVPEHGLAFVDGLFDALEALAATSATTRRMIDRLAGAGVNMGDPALRAQIEAWAASGGLTRAEADALLALPLRPARRAELLGLGALTEAHITAALAG